MSMLFTGAAHADVQTLQPTCAVLSQANLQRIPRLVAQPGNFVALDPIASLLHAA